MKYLDRIDFLNEMQKHACVSGRESDLSAFLLKQEKIPFQQDDFGNLFAFKKGIGKDKRKILWEAHLDEIGFVVSEITPDGFLKCQGVGGIKQSTLPGTMVTVFGKQTFNAVIGSKPPHLSGLDSKEQDHSVLLTAGFQSEGAAKSAVRIGDVAHFYGPAKAMENGRILSRGLDNKVSVLAAMDAFSRLGDPYHDITLLLSVGEETTTRGAHAFTNTRSFDIGLVLDAGFGSDQGVDPTHTIDLDGGPSVSITEREHVGMEKRIIKIAQNHSIPCQIIAEPGGTGTDSRVIQVRHGGIPTAVISIPVLNMHSPSEIASVKDLDNTAKLLLAVAKEPEIPEGKAVRYV